MRSSTRSSPAAGSDNSRQGRRFSTTAGQQEIRIQLANGEVHKVLAVVGYDPEWDLALLATPTISARPLVLGNSAAVPVGQRVVAVGSPVGLTLTVSEGIVSARRGEGQVDLLQTTAAISPGSSGGPLVSSRGLVVGMTTAFLTPPEASLTRSRNEG